MQEEVFKNPVYSVRVEEWIKEWLKKEAKSYKSPNIFFKELRKRYDRKIKNT